MARRIQHLSKKFQILYYEEDLNFNGFYAVCAKDFDDKVRLMHSHDEKINLKLEWRLERDSIRFFDLHVVSEEVGRKRDTSITLLGLDTNRFVLCEFKYFEKAFVP